MAFRILLCLATFLLTSVIAQVKAPQAPPAPVATPSPATPEPIPLTQIAVRGEELARTLRDISRKLPPDPQLTALDEQLRDREELIQSSLWSSTEALEGHATLMDLREQSREWRTFTVTESRDRDTLSDWGAACEQSLAGLNKARAEWDATLKAATSLPEYATVLPRIRSALRDIDRVQTEAEHHVRLVLDLQSRLSKQALTVTDVLERLAVARQHIRA